MKCLGVCHKKAIAKGFSHARLPIDEFVKLHSRKVSLKLLLKSK